MTLYQSTMNMTSRHPYQVHSIYTVVQKKTPPLFI